MNIINELLSIARGETDSEAIRLHLSKFYSSGGNLTDEGKDILALTARIEQMMYQLKSIAEITSEYNDINQRELEDITKGDF